MSERFEIVSPEKPNRSYFEGTPSSKEFIAAKKFIENYVDSGKLTVDLTDTPENIEAIRAHIEKLGNRLMPGISTDGVISELKEAGVLTTVVIEKVKKEKEVDFLETEYISLEKPRQLEVDEQQQQIIEANLLYEELEKANIFKNPEELDMLYSKTTESQGNVFENEQYYYEFSKAGLIKGGDEEVAKDLADLNQRKQDFANKEVADIKTKNKLERAKKVATLTEQAVVEGVTKLLWFGENVTMQRASEFDDIKRGVDDILEIKKEDEDSTFMGLGIDVTFRGLYSEQFKEKFFKLLQSIKDGHKTKVKYAKNHKGELMKEFAIPKMVLYFSVEDVKDMIDILKYTDDPNRGEKLEKNLQGLEVMGQIIDSCRLLAEFAEESQNNIFRKYVAVLNSLKELAWENKTIGMMLEASPDHDVWVHLKKLIEEFNLIKNNA